MDGVPVIFYMKYVQSVSQNISLIVYVESLNQAGFSSSPRSSARKETEHANQCTCSLTVFTLFLLMYCS